MWLIFGVWIISKSESSYKNDIQRQREGEGFAQEVRSGGANEIVRSKRWGP